MRKTGVYRIIRAGGEEIRCFVPAVLPPQPALQIDSRMYDANHEAVAALGRLSVAAALVPNTEWFLYGFVRKEALISSQIEGTQATLQDVVTFELTRRTANADDAEEVCNYVKALEYARAEVNKPRGLPLSSRLICEIHARLMKGIRGAEKQPGTIRTSQNWIGGTRPGNARFVPPPPELVRDGLSQLEKWIHGRDALPPLIKAGMAHVQFETIHPFLDGNGRVGRLLISLLVEHWKLLSCPLLYLSLAFKRHQQEYYDRLSSVRETGDWEGWTLFFLNCVTEAADDGVDAARRIFSLLEQDRRAVVGHRVATVTSIQLFEKLAQNPVVTLASTLKMLKTTKPTASKAIDALKQAGVLKEITGRKRDRAYAYSRYIEELAKEDVLPRPVLEVKPARGTRTVSRR
jgi:Fic family protein